MKILLVDDSAAMRRILKTQLNSVGFTDITEAANGQHALDILKGNPSYELMLLDVNMPHMDGLTLLKILRADSRFNKIKIIMCTSEADKSKVMQALTAGANNYIVKPFTPETLMEKLGL
jgi:two-component system chemotaxis response regulator CheY